VQHLPDRVRQTPKTQPIDMAAVNLLPEVLETERLLIRVARPGDGAAFNEAVLESLAELSPWLGWVSPPPTADESESGCRKAYARFLLNEDLMAFFFLKEGAVLVGGSGLHKADWTLRQFEMGYWCRTRYGGKGLMTEGVSCLANHALEVLEASRVFLTTDDRNVSSWRLAERAGFQLEGILRNERLDLMGNFRNTRVYSRIAA
jgi:RimJ/RimL family protein N-acetyltransferase